MRKRPASTYNVMHNAFLNKFVSFECVSLEIDQTNALCHFIFLPQCCGEMLCLHYIAYSQSRFGCLLVDQRRNKGRTKFCTLFKSTIMHRSAFRMGASTPNEISNRCATPNLRVTLSLVF